jgi:hypothetical protein
MTAKERILVALERAGGPICDDCLTPRADLSRRQEANAACRFLHHEGKISRKQESCACCGGDKLTNRSFAGGAQPRTHSSTPERRQVQTVPSIHIDGMAPAICDRSRDVDNGSPDIGPDRDFGGFRFTLVCAIRPERDSSGEIRPLTPHAQNSHRFGLVLHRYGAGPFCRFRIPGDLPLKGVYLLSTHDHVRYVGECENLSRRYNAGYGQISPRSCYVGGQSTNCKINHLVAEAVRSTERVELWFCQTEDRWRVERDLISRLRPDWNGRQKIGTQRRS